MSVKVDLRQENLMNQEMRITNCRTRPERRDVDVEGNLTSDMKMKRESAGHAL